MMVMVICTEVFWIIQHMDSIYLSSSCLYESDVFCIRRAS